MKKYLISIDSDDGVRLKNFFAQQIFATCKNDFMKFGVKGAELTVKEYFDLGVIGHNKALTPSELGCTLSHLEALKDFLKSDASLALVFEDDVIQNLDFSLVELEKEVRGLNLKPSFFLSLGGIQLKHSQKVKGHIYQQKLLDKNILEVHPFYYKKLVSAYAYIVDREMAALLLAYHNPPKIFDHWGDLEYVEKAHHFYATYLFDHPVIQNIEEDSYLEQERLEMLKIFKSRNTNKNLYSILLKKIISLFLKSYKA